MIWCPVIDEVLTDAGKAGMRMNRQTRDQLGAMRAWVLVSQLGLTMVLPLVAGVWLGSFLDRWAGTGGLITVGGILLGLVVGITGVYQILKKELRWK
jgi:ATP synthase protein I